MQKCSACLEVKPLHAFHRDKSKRLGVASSCKECAKARARNWFANHQERGKRQRAAWHEANRERHIKRMKEYRLENYEARLKTNRAWARANKDRKLAMDRAWQKANPEKVKIYQRVCMARRRAAEGFHTADDIAKIRKMQRGKCAICRSPLHNDDHADHIVPIAKGGTSWPRNIQLLCAPCNLKKHARDPIDYMQSLGLLL